MKPQPKKTMPRVLFSEPVDPRKIKKDDPEEDEREDGSDSELSSEEGWNE
jgi:hypothetical protein